jgi:uncharacterized protein YjbI with pentapeptide repeats
VTHADLFLENPVKLPFLGVELPLVAFFFLAPILFLIVHAYVLVHLVMLTDKAKLYHQALHQKIEDKEIRDGLRRQLPSNVFVQFLAGAPEARSGPFGWALRAIGWATLVIGPVLLLLMMQTQFLAYHSLFIAWTQRLALAGDLILIWWLWGRILSGRETGRHKRVWRGRAWSAVGFAFRLGAIFFAGAVATFPGEWQKNHLPGATIFPKLTEANDEAAQLKEQSFGEWIASYRDWIVKSGKVSLDDWLFNSPVDRVTRRRRLPFSNTLVLTGFNTYEGLKIDDPEKATKWRDFVFRARGRDLRGAIFDLASLPRVDFSGANLEGASLKSAQLDRASFDGAQLKRASLVGAQLPAARLLGAQLPGVRLDDAQLQGAALDGAQLQGAWLLRAKLQDAKLDNAQLQDAELDGAQLQRASLAGVQLQRASLSTVQLGGASLDKAQLQGARLDGTQLQGARLDDAQLQGAQLDSAQLQGASLDGAQLQGAWLDGAQLQGASLHRANLEGASLYKAQLQAASFESSWLAGASFYKADLRGAEFTITHLFANQLSEAQLWRSSGRYAVHNAVLLLGATNAWKPVWVDEYDQVHPWDAEAYQRLRKMIETVPTADLRDKALARIHRLDCESPDPEDTGAGNFRCEETPKNDPWRESIERASVNYGAYSKALASWLKDLACSPGGNAPYVLSNLTFSSGDLFLGQSRFADTGTEASELIGMIMSKDCPVSASLTEAVKARLLEIKQTAIEQCEQERGVFRRSGAFERCVADKARQLHIK